MSESAEHDFLKRVILEVLEEFSQLRLYGLTEAARRRFDFLVSLGAGLEPTPYRTGCLAA
jgi:hypothetical protein